ncbi:MAG: class I SAM-dependent methyltransferase [Thermoproteota archaeon]
MSRLHWDEVVEDALGNSLKLGVPAIRTDDTYVIYSVAYLTALRFGGLRAIDAGAGTGFSTIWVAKALYESGVDGRIYAVEKSVQRFRKLKELVDKHCLNHLIIPVNGDALEYVRNIENGLNFVFMDIEKEYYLGFFKRIRDKILSEGVILAHNTKHSYGTIKAFLKEASEDGWRTTIVSTEEGISISFKLHDPVGSTPND